MKEKNYLRIEEETEVDRIPVYSGEGRIDRWFGKLKDEEHPSSPAKRYKITQLSVIENSCGQFLSVSQYSADREEGLVTSKPLMFLGIRLDKGLDDFLLSLGNETSKNTKGGQE